MLKYYQNNRRKKKKKKLTKRVQTTKIKILIFYDIPPVQLSPGTIQFPDRPNISKDFMKLLSSHALHIHHAGSSITLYLKKTWKTSAFSCLPFFFSSCIFFSENGGGGESRVSFSARHKSGTQTVFPSNTLN